MIDEYGWGNRTKIIQSFLSEESRYLEIGLGNGENFDEIQCVYKISVDPYGSPDYLMTSDEFFEKNEEMFDVIFLDGLHEHGQLYRDIINSLGCLSSGGCIVCHDISPAYERFQDMPKSYDGWSSDEWSNWRRENNYKPWTGDCWKAWVRLRSERNDLDMRVFDTDHGVGVISRGFQNTIDIPDILNWDWLVKNRSSVLNLEDYK